MSPEKTPTLRIRPVRPAPVGPRIRLLLNPGASRAPDDAALQEAIAAMPGAEVITLGEGDDLMDVARKAAAAADVVVAAGGDGTVAAVASALIGGDVTLGILPLGTANDLATQLGIPSDPIEALQLVANGERRRLDVLELTLEDGRTRCVLNVANGGFAAQVGAIVDSEAKSAWGAFAYARAAIDAESPVHRVHVQLDDAAPEALEAVVVAIANGATCGGGVRVAPTADLEDGLLDLLVVRPASAARLATLAARLRVGKLEDHELLERRVGRSLTMRCEPPMPFSLDGELEPSPVVSARVRPAALSVVVGPSYRRGDVPRVTQL
ncbi:MAG: YegS/Rv2252/BmrU family lipid kinase [Sandaracinus sp.]|nr:YegS/Rv2252/BmrU family lipid kinase [Sandaracinus sp.]